MSVLKPWALAVARDCISNDSPGPHDLFLLLDYCSCDVRTLPGSIGILQLQLASGSS